MELDQIIAEQYALWIAATWGVVTLLLVGAATIAHHGERNSETTERWMMAKRNAPDELYRDFPDHPLHDVPKVVLDAAREVMREAADWKDVDAEMADALADSVVVELRPWLSWGVELAAEAPEPANWVDDTEVRSPEAVGVALGGAPGPVGLAGGPEDAVGSQGVDGVALEGHHAGEATEVNE